MKRFFIASRKTGQALVEYSMILAFVAVMAIVVAKTVGKKTANSFDSIQNTMSSQGIVSSIPMAPGSSVRAASSNR